MREPVGGVGERGKKRGRGPAKGRVSDQGSGFGLVASVPLHVCQLRAQGAAQEAAVGEGPAGHGRGEGHGQGVEPNVACSAFSAFGVFSIKS